MRSPYSMKFSEFRERILSWSKEHPDRSILVVEDSRVRYLQSLSVLDNKIAVRVGRKSKLSTLRRYIREVEKIITSEAWGSTLVVRQSDEATISYMNWGFITGPRGGPHGEPELIAVFFLTREADEPIPP